MGKSKLKVVLIMNFKLKKIISILLLVSIFSGYFHVDAVRGGVLDKPEERIDSIIRRATEDTDKEKVRDVLNESIRMRIFSIPGGGYGIFEPYEFHKDEVRRVCVFTIPYLLDDRFPVLQDLVDMLWCSVSIMGNSDPGEIDIGFMTTTQNLVNHFNHVTNEKAEFIDVALAIRNYLEDRAEHESTSSEEIVAAKNRVRDFYDKFVKKIKEWKKPVVSQSVTAVNLLIKLFFCIEEKRYIQDGRFHNVFVMAYDIGADNSWFLTKLFKGKRPQVETCVDFISVDGLDQSTVKDESNFLEQYTTLSVKVQQHVNTFLGYNKAKSFADRLKTMEEKTDAVDQKAEAAKQTAEAAGQKAEAVEQELEGLKLTVAEMQNAQQEQSKFNEFTKAVGDLGAYLHRLSKGGEIVEEEKERVFQNVEKLISYYDSSEEIGKPDEMKDLRGLIDDTRQHVAKHASDIIAQKKEMSGVHDEISDTRQHVAKHAEDIITLKQKMSGMQAEMSDAHEAFDHFVQAKKDWEARAIKIDELVNKLRRDEEYLQETAKKGARDFIWEEYNQSGIFRKWRLQRVFPFLKKKKEAK